MANGINQNQQTETQAPDRNALIRNIEGLYPADSQYDDTRHIGQNLMKQAMRSAGFTWRDLPEKVLVEYERLCREEEGI